MVGAAPCIIWDAMERYGRWRRPEMAPLQTHATGTSHDDSGRTRRTACRRRGRRSRRCWSWCACAPREPTPSSLQELTNDAFSGDERKRKKRMRERIPKATAIFFLSSLKLSSKILYEKVSAKNARVPNTNHSGSKKKKDRIVSLGFTWAVMGSVDPLDGKPNRRRRPIHRRPAAGSHLGLGGRWVMLGGGREVEDSFDPCFTDAHTVSPSRTSTPRLLPPRHSAGGVALRGHIAGGRWRQALSGRTETPRSSG